MSGYVKAPVYYPSSMPFELLLFLLRGVPTPLAFNWTVFILLALLPFLMYRAAVNFGFGPWERLALMGLVLAPEAMEPHLSLFAIMRAAGMVSFILASALSVYVVSLFYRFVTGGGWSAIPSLLFSASLLFIVHPTGPIMVIVPLTSNMSMMTPMLPVMVEG